MKNLVGKWKNSLKGLSSRVRAVEDKISVLEDELRNTSMYASEEVGKWP